jgi:hypothetical protein
VQRQLSFAIERTEPALRVTCGCESNPSHMLARSSTAIANISPCDQRHCAITCPFGFQASAARTIRRDHPPEAGLRDTQGEKRRADKWDTKTRWYLTRRRLFRGCCTPDTPRTANVLRRRNFTPRHAPKGGAGHWRFSTMGRLQKQRRRLTRTVPGRAQACAARRTQSTAGSNLVRGARGLERKNRSHVVTQTASHLRLGCCHNTRSP